ncbi:sialic acid-binding Ig-like lectin 14 [Halichoeres trimaculatus]|uniref:sialic acid-binding Ig-like lectin 14 n=1 Tax=Halichoeres trimaculatus TaxID=147232 RepID=UPI003D9E4BFE
MFVLILASLLFLVCGSEANAGSLAVKKTCQGPNFCITLREGVITAEAGLCVVIPCSFTTSSDFTATNIVWLKCEPPNKRCDDKDRIFDSNDPREVRSGFKGRVSLLGPDVSKGNCRIIIYNLKQSDSGSYQLRVEGTISNQGTKVIFSKKASISVKDLTQEPTVIIPPLTEEQPASLSCIAPGLCSGSAPEFTWRLRIGVLGQPPIKGNNKTENLSAFAQRQISSFSFTPSAEDHGTIVTCKVSFTNRISTEKRETLNVNYFKNPVIRGERGVKLGDALTLTCSVDSFPPSVVIWTKLGSDKTLKKDTKTAKLTVPDVTAEDAGKYICSASHQIINRTAHTEVTVTVFSRILNSSACEVQSEVLTCVCISQGFPLPTIEWPLLKKQTHYSFTTSITNNTVNTSISLSVKDFSYTTVDCVSKNKFGVVKKELKVIIKNISQSESENEAYSNGPLSMLPWAVAAVFLIVNVVLVFCVVFLWTKRKTVDPNQEDRTYMSLQKTDRSPEYDVICQPLN